MPENDLSLISEAARDAGALAMRFWKCNPQVWEKPGLGPVSEADLAVNDLLADRLRRARPGYGWLSEETPDDAARLNCERLFILDPIDGTRAFIAGEKHFAISIAVAELGRVVAGAIYLPALERLYTAADNGTAQCNGTPIRCANRAELAGANLLMSKSFLDQDHWHTPPHDLKRSFRSSIAYRLCLIAEGSFDGMISTRDAWEWDIAAGSLIAARAGAAVSDRHGVELRFNSPGAKTAGIFTAPLAVHSEILTNFKA
ncbi:MAG: 3'(2'),5'-bisphosphate nucleotidase CysQ [Paracoccaceae bacterium]